MPVGALAFASFAAIRADRALVTFDAMAALALAFGWAAAMAGVAMTRRPLSALVVTGADCAVATAVGAIRLSPALRTESDLGTSLRGRAALFRGLLLALPVLLVFVALFSTADAVFATFVRRVLAPDLELGDLPRRLVVLVVTAWSVGGLVALVARATPTFRAVRTPPAVTRVGRTEAHHRAARGRRRVRGLRGAAGRVPVRRRRHAGGGGDDLQRLRPARIFELVAAAGLVGLLLFALELTVTRRSRAYVLASSALVGLTFIVVLSAGYRLTLYQAAYGWTELRFLVMSTIVWLGICLALALVTILTDRSRWLIHAAAMAGIVVALAANVIGPQAFVVRQNVARAIEIHTRASRRTCQPGRRLSHRPRRRCHPHPCQALPALPQPDRANVADRLEHRRRQLERLMPTLGWPSWNVARDEAHAVCRRRRWEPRRVRVDVPVD